MSVGSAVVALIMLTKSPTNATAINTNKTKKKKTNFSINFGIKTTLVLCEICEPAFTDHSAFLLSQ